MRGVRCEIWKNCNGSNKGAATQMAILYDLLGEADRAFACLEEAYRYRQPLLQLANVQPEWIACDQTRASAKCWQSRICRLEMHSSAQH
jgi:hypothetical protein